jgi:endonuclease/exonuclease/phosphatase family metal-dependent hydrolase
MAASSSRLRRAVRAFLALVASAVLVAASATLSRLTVVAFNVLAPVWASPLWYPEAMDPGLLGREFPRDRLTAFLRQLAPVTDVFCLQEVARSEFGYFQQAAGPAFEGFMAENDPTFWSNWLVPDIPWEPNGTALLVRTSSIGSLEFADLALGTGNHAAVAEGIHSATGRAVRIGSLHLDSDHNSNRLNELRTVLCGMLGGEGLDVLCGDFNEDTVTGSVSGPLTKEGFVDALASLGIRRATHPWSTTYYNSRRWAIIDHIVTRNATAIGGEVIDFDTSAIDDELSRIEENFRRRGSDHYPIRAELQVLPH